MTPNENKMSDGGRERASPGVKVWKSSQSVDAARFAVRSIAWLGLLLLTELMPLLGQSRVGFKASIEIAGELLLCLLP